MWLNRPSAKLSETFGERDCKTCVADELQNQCRSLVENVPPAPPPSLQFETTEAWMHHVSLHQFPLWSCPLLTFAMS